MDDTTFNNWSESTERNLVTDISRTLGNLSSTTRSRRRMRKLREELVREHIEGAAGHRGGWMRKLLGRALGG